MKYILCPLIIVIATLQMNAQEFKYTSYNKRHDGFFLSLNVGPNHVDVLNKQKDKDSEDSEQTQHYYRGFGGEIDLKAGAALSDNLIVHGTLIYYRMSGPEIEEDETVTDLSGGEVINEAMLGGGLTYYLKSVQGTFLSGSVGVGGFNFTENITGYSGSSNPGVAFQLQAGKDWILTDRIALGFTFSYGVCNATYKPTNAITQKLNSNNWSIMLHMAFN